jgi:hypothetical protein
MPNVSEDVLRTIGGTRAWVKNYGTVLALARNPKTPVAIRCCCRAIERDEPLSAIATRRGLRVVATHAVRGKCPSASAACRDVHSRQQRGERSRPRVRDIARFEPGPPGDHDAPCVPNPCQCESVLMTSIAPVRARRVDVVEVRRSTGC